MYSFVDEAPPRLQMHALRLLVNLSCDDVTIPSLLAAQVSDGPISGFHACGLISDGVPSYCQ